MTTIDTEVLEQALTEAQEFINDVHYGEWAGSGNRRNKVQDTLARAFAALAAQQEQTEPLFWYRPCSDMGYEGPIHNDSLERVRRLSGAWKPLYTAPPTPAVPQGCKLVPIDATTDMLANAERTLDKKNWDYIDDAVWKAMLSAAPTPGGIAHFLAVSRFTLATSPVSTIPETLASSRCIARSSSDLEKQALSGSLALAGAGDR